eukprot:TRINITY_DN26611_c0_g1_i1.p1 TRINITY_DN26611_c0_g1~~TRINITY_DN26611_c0_g1_i1.p1  ORF type:complete len:201 (+),score=4.96 TRINITY_DN26611_c0_g1_i1:63-665(+)
MGATCTRCRSTNRPTDYKTVVPTEETVAVVKKKQPSGAKRCVKWTCCLVCSLIIALVIILAYPFFKYQQSTKSFAGLTCDPDVGDNVVALHIADCSGICYQAPQEYINDCVIPYLNESDTQVGRENDKLQIVTPGSCLGACGADVNLGMAPDYFFRPNVVCTFYPVPQPTWLMTENQFKVTGMLQALRGYKWRGAHAKCA